jgi:hypothetical protein
MQAYWEGLPSKTCARGEQCREKRSPCNEQTAIEALSYNGIWEEWMIPSQIDGAGSK